MLERIIEKGIDHLHQQGYIYLKQSLQPALKQVSHGTDALIVGEIYCLMADLHDLNGAPLQALQFYQKAITFDTNWAAPYQEVARVLAQVGRYFEAFQYINKAIAADPHDANLISEKQKYQDDMNYDVEPLYTKENEIWKWAELLAQEEFAKVIQQILAKKTNGIENLKCLNRAYGALEKVDLYLENWQKMEEREEELELEDADWFYMPQSLKPVLGSNK